MVVVLCYLGNSPMHAEISNTKLPTASLTPCRNCDLRVDSAKDKCSDAYVRDFVGIDSNGVRVCYFSHVDVLHTNPMSQLMSSVSTQSNLVRRNWNVTQSQTRKVWEITRNHTDEGKIAEAQKIFGIRDKMLDHFIKEALIQKNQLGFNGLWAFCDSTDQRLGDRIFNCFFGLPGKCYITKWFIQAWVLMTCLDQDLILTPTHLLRRFMLFCLVCWNTLSVQTWFRFSRVNQAKQTRRDSWLDGLRLTLAGQICRQFNQTLLSSTGRV